MTKETKNHIKYWLTHHPYPPVEDIVEMYQEEGITEAEVRRIEKLN